MTDIVIVGGGPVGLGLALDLSLKGITSTVLERSTKLHQIPKGQNLTQRTGEHFRTWGVSKAVRKASPIPPEFGNSGLVAYGNLQSEFTYDWFQRSKVGAYYFADNERLPQYALEQVLRDKAAQCPEVTFVTGANVTGISQDDESVRVELETRNGTKSIDAKYCVGCDGARSTTRRLTEIESDTDHAGPRMALLVFRSQELHDDLERFPGKSIFNVMNPDLDGYWQFLGRVDLDGGWFFHSPVPVGTTEDNFDFHAFVHQFVGKEIALEIEHIGFWDLRISQAKTYRKQRVFIAGDACHSHPPYGGYGINTGLEDACNISWKLAAVLNGWARDELLDSYEAERHPVFKSVHEDFISRMIEDFRSFTQRYNPERNLAEFQAAWADRTNADDSDVTQFLPNYAGSPIVFGKPGANSSATGSHSFVAEAGFHLAPPTGPSGRDLWDQLGDGFTLLQMGKDPHRVQAFQRAFNGLGVPLKVLDLPKSFQAAYKTEAVLIRPDKFIAWVAGHGMDDPLMILNRAIGKIGN